MDLRLDASSGAISEVPLIMLLDREADVFLAQRSAADAWLVKPLDALRLRKAVAAATSGDSYTEGVPLQEVIVEVSEELGSESDEAETPESETVDAG
jgi:DNA-binding response OmpR family regulator